MYIRTDEFDQIFNSIYNAPYVEPPPPWALVNEINKEVIIGIGFTKDGESLALLAPDGRELYDCNSGKCIKTDHEEFHIDVEWWSDHDLSMKGIGPYKTEWIKMSCFFGGGLHVITEDDWRLSDANIVWPIKDIILNPPCKKRDDLEYLKIYQVGTSLVGYGFSSSGKTMAIAARDELMIYHRAELLFKSAPA